MKNSNIQNFLTLNLALLLIATAAPLGNFINLPAPISIWCRCFVALFVVGGLILYKKETFKFNVQNDLLGFVVSSALQGIHWVTYFLALQKAGAGIGIISLFTYPIFTAILEPIMLKQKFHLKYIFLGLLVLVGLFVLTPSFNLENKLTEGIAYGIISAITYAIRNIKMKKYLSVYNSKLLMFYQCFFVVILLSPVFFFYDASNIATQYPYLIFLGVITTGFGHTLLVQSFKYFSATSAALLSCLQPLYAIVQAYFFIDEIPTLNTMIGGLIIILAVVIESLTKQKVANS